MTGDRPPVALAVRGIGYQARSEAAGDRDGVLGEEAVSPAERRRLDFATAMNAELLAQAPDENRTLEATLDRGWQVVSLLPRADLTMLSDAALAARYREEGK